MRMKEGPWENNTLFLYSCNGGKKTAQCQSKRLISMFTGGSAFISKTLRCDFDYGCFSATLLR